MEVMIIIEITLYIMLNIYYTYILSHLFNIKEAEKGYKKYFVSKFSYKEIEMQLQ